jgi:prepilin-type N-terminal cleavage/methylation domain-containing protein
MTSLTASQFIRFMSSRFMSKHIFPNRKDPPTHYQSRSGYTLIETLLVLLVVAFILALGASSFIHTIPKYRLQGAVWEVSARLNEARYTAILKGVPVRMRFSGSGYCLERHDPEGGAWLRLSGRSLEGVSLQANNAPIFHPQGTVSNLVTIWVENAWGRYKITLAITGRIKVAKG